MAAIQLHPIIFAIIGICNLCLALQFSSYPTEFRAKGRYTITYTPADSTNTTLALVRPDSSPDLGLTASLYNITKVGHHGQIIWPVKPESWLWTMVDQYGAEWRLVLCQGDQEVMCAPRSDVVRLVRGAVNGTRTAATTALPSSTSSALFNGENKELGTAEKAGMGVGVSVAGVVLLVAVIFVVLHCRRRASEAVKSNKRNMGSVGISTAGGYGSRTILELDTQQRIAELTAQSEPVEMGTLRHTLST